MSGFIKALVGLLCLWGLAVAVRYVHAPVVAADLKARAQAALEQAGLEDVQVSLNEDDFGFSRIVRLSADNPTPETVAEAKKAVLALDGVHSAVWPQGQRTALLDTEAPEEIEPEEQTASPVQEEQQEAPQALPEKAENLSAAETDISQRPDSVVEEETSPYRWQASINDKTVSLSGDVPDRETRNAVVAIVQNRFPDFSIDNRLTIRKDGVPEGAWLDMATKGLAVLSGLKTGSAQLEDTTLTVEGKAPDASTAQALRQELEQGVPEGYTASSLLKVAKTKPIAVEEASDKQQQRSEPELSADEKDERTEAAAACEEAIKTELKNKTIQFATAKTSLRDNPNPLLDSIATIAADCPNATITIEGHTDRQGLASKNMRISRERAETVRQYLIDKGLDADRLKAVGFGETRLLDKGETAEAYARNRRIEFVVDAETGE